MRRAGLLLHPTSLPGPFGMGDLGPISRELLAWMDAAGLRVWQMLPVTACCTTGSPYSGPSGLAAESLLLSIDDLLADGWLRPDEKTFLRGAAVDYASVRAHRQPLVTTAAMRVAKSMDLAAWSSTRPWLGTWALFQALVESDGADWTRWPDRLRLRDPATLDAARDRLTGAVDAALGAQWLFERQWERLRAEAAVRGIALWGDLPILVDHASADVWSWPEGWRLDAAGHPLVVSGAPPDAFTPLGQRWGHPLPDVVVQAGNGWRWMSDRAATALWRFDTVRIDHFRGFSALWAVPVGDVDATRGSWTAGPGQAALDALRVAAQGRPLPYVAEDLGVITDDVVALRDAFGAPGMAVLQFAFGPDPQHAGGDHPYLPHRHLTHQVVFTGTHDNDTSAGWYDALPEGERDRVRRYLGTDDRGMPWALVVAALRSVADTAILPMQDLLGLPSSARMNTPGQAGGSFTWRMGRDALNSPLARRVREQVSLSGRDSS